MPVSSAFITKRIFLVGHCFTYVQLSVYCLTGHVCTREKADNYLTSYNQAFLCQERYTTSCGHLDWRRCTRYRIQTCFTPKQRYATRYHQVETCCPGWREDETGSCSIPICPVTCKNGGSCGDKNGIPTCICEEGYHGDTCQHERNNWEAWQSVVLCISALILVLSISMTVFVCKRLSQRSTRNFRSNMIDMGIRPNTPSLNLSLPNRLGVNHYSENRDQQNVHNINNRTIPDGEYINRAYPTAPQDSSEM